MAEKPPAEGKSNDAPPNADSISKKVKEDVNKQSKEEKRAEKKAIDEICRRQAKLEAKEIKQTWNIVFGNVKPKKKKEIYKIDGITLRNIWLEPLFIFNKIVNLFPQERFHPVKSYALQWQAPGNSYRMIVPLEDPVVQERTVMNISWYPKVQQKRILFFFAPIDPLMTMFAPSIHPASLVSYRSKVAVLHKLCDLYVQHKISLDEFQKIMGCNYDIWCVTLYNLLPEDAQPFHTYLLHPPPVVVDKQSLEKKYLHELINLNEYNDLKFPDRTKKREEESKTYPLPYATAQCVICKDMDTGIIKCQNCGNMVCVPCVHREFLDPVTRTGSFLLMHRKFCLRLGKLPDIHAEVIHEPFYLRELRETGRIRAVELMLHDHDKDGHVEVQQSVEDELGDDEESEEERLARLERERVERENPPELQQIQILVQVEAKKRDKQRKEVLKYQRSIDEPGHTDQFQARQLRLKMECLEKCTKILKRLKKLQAKVEEMKLEGEFARACIEDIESVCQDIERLYAMNNAEEYEAAAKAAEEEQHPVPAPAVPAEEEDEALQDIE